MSDAPEQDSPSEIEWPPTLRAEIDSMPAPRRPWYLTIGPAYLTIFAWAPFFDPLWRHDLASDYDVVVAVNTVHWFSPTEARKVLGDIFQALRSGGAFLLMEPAGAEPLFTPGFQAWQKEQPSQHKYEDWRRFWMRVKDLVGYDYGLLGAPEDSGRIADELSVRQWIRVLTDAGFESIDILLRDSEKVVLAGVKP